MTVAAKLTEILKILVVFAILLIIAKFIKL